LAGAKLPSRKASSHLSRPSASRAPSKVNQALSRTSSSSHCFSRRRQVEATDIHRAKNATRLRFAAPKGCPQGRSDSMPRDGPGCPACTAAQEAKTLPTPTARLSTAPADLLGRRSSPQPPYAYVPDLMPNLLMKHALVPSVA
jgi:hypothetical protein